MTLQDQSSEMDDIQDQDSELRNKRRSCIFKILILWFSIMVLVIIGIIFVRSNAVRDPEEVRIKTAQFLEIGQLPEGFYPYSYTSFFGMTLCVFYNENDLREDGRTTSIIAVNVDSRFKGKTVQEAKNRLFRDLETRLEKREFKVQNRRTETLMRQGQEVEIYVFEGTHLMEMDHIPATTCYRFLMGPEGPVYIHSMGLNRTFGVQEQIQAHLAFQPKRQ